MSIKISRSHIPSILQMLLGLLLLFDSSHAFHVSPKLRGKSVVSSSSSSSSRLFAEPLNRRQALKSSLPIVLGILPSYGKEAKARGLVQFPCYEPLGNTYHFMRAGESLLEAENVWSTNPLFVTNREAALSPKGIEQVEASIKAMQQHNPQPINPTIIRYAIAASSTDTANIVGRDMKVTRDRMVPEFNYLEPRAVGGWDMLELTATEKAVWAMDVTEAGPQGTNSAARPPPNEDGTPNETLADVTIRLRQLLSVLETQYSGDVVLLIASDGTTLALLSCMMAGIPYNQVHELEYQPGEVRFNVNMETILTCWKEKQGHLEDYNTIIDEGKMELKRLREMKDVVSLRDRQLEEENREVEAEMQRRQEQKQQEQKEELLARQARAKEIQERNGGRPIFSPFRVGAVGLGALGAAVATGTSLSSDDDNDKQVLQQRRTETEEPKLLETKTLQNPDSGSLLPAPPLEERVFDPEFDGVKSKNPLPWTAAKTVQIAPTTTTTTTNNSRDGGPTSTKIVPPADRKEAADEAMKEYLDQDDGGEEWITLLADMIKEEDDDTDK